MENELFTSVIQALCNHSKHEHYSQRRFDILKGFEMVETKCLNCHKILDTEIKKFGNENIFNNLNDQHKQLRYNLKKILSVKLPIKDVYSETADALIKHFEGEEKFLFPKLENNKKFCKLIYRLCAEHNIAKEIINDLDSTLTSEDNERWLAKVKVLYDIVSHNFKVEEKIFPKAKDIISDDENAHLEV